MEKMKKSKVKTQITKKKFDNVSCRKLEIIFLIYSIKLLEIEKENTTHKQTNKIIIWNE